MTYTMYLGNQRYEYEQPIDWMRCLGEWHNEATHLHEDTKHLESLCVQMWDEAVPPAVIVRTERAASALADAAKYLAMATSALRAAMRPDIGGAA